MTRKGRVNWLYNFEWMARKIETDIRRERKKNVWRSRWGFRNSIQTWIEQLLEFYQDYEPRNILNLDELELFFEALPGKGLMDKEKTVKDGKKSKRLMLLCLLLLLTDGSFGFEPTVIWRSYCTKNEVFH